LWFYVPLDTKEVILETFPQANLLAWYRKKLNLTQQKHAFTNQKKCTTAQTHTHLFNGPFSEITWVRYLVPATKINKKLKPGLGTFYNIQPGNGAGLFSKKNIIKEKVKKKV